MIQQQTYLKVADNTGAVAINCGALAGGNFPTSNLGVIFRGLADTAFEASPDVAAVETFGMEMKIFLFSVLFSLVLVTIFRFGFKENRNIGKGVTFKKPEIFTKDQKNQPVLFRWLPDPGFHSERRRPEHAV